MNFVLTYMLLSGCDSFIIPSIRSIQNKALGYIFKQITPEANWPKTSLEDIGHFKYYDTSTVTPPYYKVDFHCYDNGNLNPIAAQESRSANSAVFSNHYSGLSGEESSEFIRDSHSTKTILKSRSGFTTNKSKTIVDLGCGVGISTQHLRNTFPDDLILGIDLSPYFLNETGDIGAIFAHRDIAHTYLPDNFVDIISISYVLHEMPYMETLKVLREAFRILKPGGVLSVLDMHNPVAYSPMMKFIFDRTEPYLGDYKEFITNKDHDLKSIGFVEIESCYDYPKTIMFSAKK